MGPEPDITERKGFRPMTHTLLRNTNAREITFCWHSRVNQWNYPGRNSPFLSGSIKRHCRSCSKGWCLKLFLEDLAHLNFPKVFSAPLINLTRTKETTMVYHYGLLTPSPRANSVETIKASRKLRWVVWENPGKSEGYLELVCWEEVGGRKCERQTVGGKGFWILLLLLSRG